MAGVRPSSFAYVPFESDEGRTFAITAGTPGDPAALATEVRAAVQALMARSGLRMTLGGIAIGVPAALASTRALEGILSGTSPTDPAVFAAVTATLAVVAVLASWLPARRAARVDPLTILRSE